jgi:hypothetical protein
MFCNPHPTPAPTSPALSFNSQCFCKRWKQQKAMRILKPTNPLCCITVYRRCLVEKNTYAISYCRRAKRDIAGSKNHVYIISISYRNVHLFCSIRHHGVSTLDVNFRPAGILAHAVPHQARHSQAPLRISSPERDYKRIQFFHEQFASRYDIL